MVDYKSNDRVDAVVYAIIVANVICFIGGVLKCLYLLLMQL